MNEMKNVFSKQEKKRFLNVQRFKHMHEFISMSLHHRCLSQNTLWPIGMSIDVEAAVCVIFFLSHTRELVMTLNCKFRVTQLRGGRSQTNERGKEAKSQAPGLKLSTLIRFFFRSILEPLPRQVNSLNLCNFLSPLLATAESNSIGDFNLIESEKKKRFAILTSRSLLLWLFVSQLTKAKKAQKFKIDISRHFSRCSAFARFDGTFECKKPAETVDYY